MVSVGCKGGTCGGWRDLGKGVGIKMGSGDILGKHQAIAAASMNNVAPSICRVCRPMHPLLSLTLYYSGSITLANEDFS